MELPGLQKGRYEDVQQVVSRFNYFRFEGEITNSSPDGQTGNDHISVPDSVNFIHIKILDYRIKQGIEVIEQGHHIHGRGAGTEVGELDNITEEDRHRLILLRLYRNTQGQALGHGGREYLV